MSLPDKITEKRAKVVQPNKQASKQPPQQKTINRIGNSEGGFSIRSKTHRSIKISRQQLFQKVDGL